MWTKEAIWRCLASAIPRQWGNLANFFIADSWTTPNCRTFGSSIGKRPACIFYWGECSTKSRMTTSDNFNKSLFNMPNRSVCKNFVSFEHATFLYMERGIENISTPEIRRSRCWLHWCLFYGCPRMHIFSSSTPGWMHLSSFAFGEH